ncbi:MAG TPA: beta-propeller domain-containing protein, partial [archaeon]|nr:beta-propeller domain-containing protein [archaeon]
MKKSILGMLILMLVLIIVSGCLTEKRVEEKKEPAKLETGTYISPDLETVEATQELRKFESKKELAEFLQKSQRLSSGAESFFLRGAVGGVMAESAVQTALPSAASKDAAQVSGTEYSTTNVQVEGVDEADFIKNDGKYIYIIADNKLVIVEAFPAEEGKILSETKINGSASKIFLNENKVIVFSEK